MTKHKNPFSVRPIRKDLSVKERLKKLRRVRHALFTVAVFLLGVTVISTLQKVSAVDITPPSAAPSVSGAPTAPAAFSVDAPQTPGGAPAAASGITPSFSGGNFRGYVFNQAAGDASAEASPLQIYDYTNVWGRLNVINGIWNTGESAPAGGGGGAPPGGGGAPPDGGGGAPPGGGGAPPGDTVFTLAPAGDNPTCGTVAKTSTVTALKFTISANKSTVLNGLNLGKTGNMSKGTYAIFDTALNKKLTSDMPVNAVGYLGFANPAAERTITATGRTYEVRLSIPPDAISDQTLSVSITGGSPGTATFTGTPESTLCRVAADGGGGAPAPAPTPTTPSVTVEPGTTITGSTIVPGTNGTPILRFTLSASNGNVPVNSITLQKSSTGTATNACTLKLYDTAQPTVAIGVAPTCTTAASENLTITGTGLLVEVGSPRNFEVRADIPSGANIPSSFRLIFQSLTAGAGAGSTINTVQSNEFTVGRPNYTVDTLTATVSGGSVTFSGRVRNAGTANAGTASNTRLRIDIGNNGGGTTWDTISPVPPNQSTSGLAAASGSETETWSSAWTATSGTHRFEVCADVGSGVTESNETDNCATQTFTVPSVAVSACGTTGTLTPLTNDQTVGCIRLGVSNGPLLFNSITLFYSGGVSRTLLTNLRLRNSAGTTLATVASIPASNEVAFACATPCSLANGNNDLTVIADIGNSCGLGQNVTFRIDGGKVVSNANGATNPSTAVALMSYVNTTPTTSPNICTNRDVYVDGQAVPTGTSVSAGPRMLGCWKVYQHAGAYPVTLTQITLTRTGTMTVNNLNLREAPGTGSPACSGAGATNLNTAVNPTGPYSTGADIIFTTNWTLGPGGAGNYTRYLVLLGDVTTGNSGQISFNIKNASMLVAREPATFSASTTFPESSSTLNYVAATNPSRLTAENSNAAEFLQASVLGDFGRKASRIFIPPVFAQSAASYGSPPTSLTGFPGELTADSFPHPVRIFDDLIIQGNSDTENGRLDLHGVLVNTQPAAAGGTHPVTIADHLWVRGNIQIDGSGIVTGALSTEGDLTTTDNLIVGGTITAVSNITTTGNIGRFYMIESASTSATGTRSATATCTAGDILIGCTGRMSVNDTNVRLTQMTPDTRARTCTAAGYVAGATGRTVTASAFCFSPDG